uniref:amine sulfotransferase-like n=1 Tax=Scatophagus argus TaxID=75038 RepID=UPI001ED833D2|nr:amine sulfotransferase-like [Scatophagus argus]
MDSVEAVINPKWRPKDLDAIPHVEIRPSDIFLITYPKSGTVWMQQILVQIMEAAQPDWVEDGTNRIRVPWLEGRLLEDPFRERPDPRIFLSHLPIGMLPLGVKEKKIKVVYVWRNPKDVLVSYYHFAHSWMFIEAPQSFEDLLHQFLNGHSRFSIYGPVPLMEQIHPLQMYLTCVFVWLSYYSVFFCASYVGSWFDHVREYYAARDQLNIHFVQYENMLKDLRGEVVKICAFLGKDLTDEAIDHVVEMSTFKNMKTNPKANYKDLVEGIQYKTDTMRKGVAGDWKNLFTVAQNERFDKVFKEKMSDFPLTCTWEMTQ